MRRIVVIAAGPAGVACATRVKRRLPGDEINLVLPAGIGGDGGSSGPAARRLAALAPNLEALTAREVGVVESEGLMPDLALKEVTVASSRGKLTIRYTDLVLEVPATVRLPRALQRAGNVFAWPMPGFAADPGALDAALASAAASGGTVLVAGGGASALEAVLLAREAGASVRWLLTEAERDPALEQQLLGLALQWLGPDVVCQRLPGVSMEHLVPALEKDGEVLAGVTPPGGAFVPCACAVWTAPLMARHPVLREEGVVLDPLGRIVIADRDACPGLRLMGSGAETPGATLPVSGVEIPAAPGGRENAEISLWSAEDSLFGGEKGVREGALGIRRAAGAGLVLYRAGLSLAEASAGGRDVEYALVSAPADGSPGQDDGPGERGRCVLSLVCDKRSRTLLGVGVLTLDSCENAADGLFGLALAALAGGTPLDALARRARPGLPGGMLATAASILLNKLDTIVRGITPDELLASHEAGAEFFTIDLRSMPDWRQGHVPGAYSIPMPQLKKRLQDEVPRFTPLVLVSARGRDAYVAACRLTGLGATDVYVLDGGMDAWPYETEKGT